MANGINVEALKLQEIERGNQFTPIQFGDIARQAVGAGQQFELGQEQIAGLRQKREEANKIEQIKASGEQGVFALVNQLIPEENRQNFFGGDPDVVRNILQQPDGFETVMKRIVEVQADISGEGQGFREQIGTDIKTGATDPQRIAARKLQQPKEGESTISNKIQIQLLQETNRFREEKGRAPNEQEQSQISSKVAVENNVGKAFTDEVSKLLIKVAEPTGTQKSRALQSRRLDNKSLEGVVKNIDKGADVISSIQNFDKAVGGIFEKDFENVISKDVVSGIKNRTLIGETDDSVMAMVLNRVIGIDESSQERQKLQKKLDTDEDFQALIKSPQFNSVFIPLVTMLNTVLAERSGAAVTENEFARLKSEFGIDIFGSPDSFVQGVRGFSNRFRDKQVNFLNTLDDTQLGKFNQRLKSRGGIDPRDLPFGNAGPTRNTSLQDSTVQRDTLIQKKSTLQKRAEELQRKANQ